MGNKRQRYTDEEWEELEEALKIKNVFILEGPTTKEWKRRLKINEMEQKAREKAGIEKQTVGGFDWYFKSEVGIRLPRPNPNKVYFNENTCSVYDEYNTLLGYGEILREVFK